MTVLIFMAKIEDYKIYKYKFVSAYDSFYEKIIAVVSLLSNGEL